MSAIREKLLAGMRPSEVLREVARANVDMSSKELIRLIDDELDGVPVAVTHAIMNWNRGRNPTREGMGLNDAQFDAAVEAVLKDHLASG